MRYENVCIEGLGYVLPERVVSSAWIEEQLAPTYAAFRIPIGRLEQLTGIRERRWWEPGFKVSDGAARAGERALADANVDTGEIQCLVNASVCKDYLEPATAAIVHAKLGLPATAVNFDVSNACLGFLNGMVVIADMIELGHIDAGIVVAAEHVGDGQLVTVERLNNNTPDMRSLRDNLASFTLGSGAVAMVLRHRSSSATGKRLLGGSAYSNTQHHELCVAGEDWMRTNSSALLAEGMKVIAANWELFKREMGWDNDAVDVIFSHQVSEKQRQIGLETLQVGPGFTSTEDIDYPTLHTLGNIASVSAPISMALGREDGFLSEGDRICMLGVGSGINSIMLGIQW
jgi:3-oxoacyl-[acyl-carrier-protein] synthase-3